MDHARVGELGRQQGTQRARENGGGRGVAQQRGQTGKGGLAHGGVLLAQLLQHRRHHRLAHRRLHLPRGRGAGLRQALHQRRGVGEQAGAAARRQEAQRLVLRLTARHCRRRAKSSGDFGIVEAGGQRALRRGPHACEQHLLQTAQGGDARPGAHVPANVARVAGAAAIHPPHQQLAPVRRADAHAQQATRHSGDGLRHLRRGVGQTLQEAWEEG